MVLSFESTEDGYGDATVSRAIYYGNEEYQERLPALRVQSPARIIADLWVWMCHVNIEAFLDFNIS